MRDSLADTRAALAGARTRDDLAGPLQTLALRAAVGEARALDLLLELVDRHDLARPAVRRLLFDHESQDDVIQDVLLAIARGIHRFEGRSHVLTWIHGIATNRTVDHLRRLRNEVGLGSVEPVSASARFSSAVATRLTVREAIEALPELYREAVRLRDVEQLRYAEVAERLDLNLNTVRARIARGRALVSDALDLSIDGP